MGKVVELSGTVQGKGTPLHGVNDDGTSRFALALAEVLREKGNRLYAASVAISNAAVEWKAKGDQRLADELQQSKRERDNETDNDDT
jgi:hypothetical protein